MSKPILSVDFDGVIHSYTSKWQAADIIPDPPVPGALAFLLEATKHFHVCIFSTRSKEESGRRAMREYLGRWSVDPAHGLPPDTELAGLAAIDFPTEKPPALVMIDDRAVCFEGTWPSIEELLSFKPWNKREPLGAAVRRLGLAGK